jgi:hypothetical protein
METYSSVWNDISMVNESFKERIGYLTIIKCASNKGDVVLTLLLATAQ